MPLLVSCMPEVKQEKVQYKTLKITTQDITTHYNFSCSLRGQQDVEIIPQASGTLMEIKVKQGETVRKGQTLFVINQVPSLAELRMAEADVQVAKARAATAKMELESKRDLNSKDIVSAIQVKKAENEYATAIACIQQAEARVTNAKQTLSFTTVTAPCDGIVGELPYRVGALVGPSITVPMTTVSNNSNILAYMSMTERDMLQFLESNDSVQKINDVLKMLPKVQLRTSTGSIYSEEGMIESIAGVINSATGTMSIRAIFPNPNGVLRSGGAGEIVIPYEVKDAIVIPQAATYSMLDQTFAYVVIDGKAKATPIKVLPTDDNQSFIVTEGLKVGDTIIAEGAGNVTEGEEIQ
mgnify:FL=1